MSDSTLQLNLLDALTLESHGNLTHAPNTYISPARDSHNNFNQASNILQLLLYWEKTDVMSSSSLPSSLTRFASCTNSA